MLIITNIKQRMIKTRHKSSSQPHRPAGTGVCHCVTFRSLCECHLQLGLSKQVSVLISCFLYAFFRYSDLNWLTISHICFVFHPFHISFLLVFLPCFHFLLLCIFPSLSFPSSFFLPIFSSLVIFHSFLNSVFYFVHYLFLSVPLYFTSFFTLFWFDSHSHLHYLLLI